MTEVGVVSTSANGKKRCRSSSQASLLLQVDQDTNNNALAKSEDWQIEWKTANSALVRSRPLLVNTSSVACCQIVVQGQGTLRRALEEENDEKDDTNSHDNKTNGNSKNGGLVRVNCYCLSSTAVEFSSLSWSSWVTIDLPVGAVVAIEGIFRVLSANDASARPTVAPLSWLDAFQTIETSFQSFAKSKAREHFAMFTSSSLEQGDEDDDDDGSSNGQVKRDQHFTVAICGAKGVGKSTCLRFCLNRLLEYSPVVAVLDADVGQPELGPPGLMSLSLLDKPLLQPPHVHFLKDHHVPTYQQAYFYGSTTSQTDPDRYLQCIRLLLQSFFSSSSRNRDIPLLINLDGWVKGLGNELLQAVITDILQPTHVIQISGDNASRNFTLHVNKETTFLHPCFAFNSKKQNDLPVITPSAAMSLPAASLRSLRLLAYFFFPHQQEEEEGSDKSNNTTQSSLENMWNQIGIGQSNQEGFLDDAHSQLAHGLAAARPYAVPMEAVQCTFCSEELAMDLQRYTAAPLVWDAMNGSIVGLCSISNTNVKTNGNNDKVLYPCVGLGIVRAVDRVHRMFYILTRVHPDVLPSVNVLCLGEISLPLEATFRGVYADTFPNVSFESTASKSNNNNSNNTHPLILGTETMQSRNTIGRKSLANNNK